MDDRPPVVSLKNVSKWFSDPSNKVVDNLNLVINHKEAGEFVALLGRSGCGKSTVLKLISGILQPDTGEVEIFGNLVTGPNSESATVWQESTCFPWRTALGNVEFGLTVKGVIPSRKVRRGLAITYLKKVGLEMKLDAYPHQLSGGEQQRVALARTLAVNPSIVLMDEPFGALDSDTRQKMQQMLLDLWEQERNVIIFVTHDIEEAVLLADRIIVFAPHPVQTVPYIVEKPVRFSRPRRKRLLRSNFEFIKLCEKLEDLLEGKTPPMDKCEGMEHSVPFY